MPVDPTTLLRLQEAADPAELFSSPDAAILLFNTAINSDEIPVILESSGYLIEWALILHDPGDVWAQTREMVLALSKSTPRPMTGNTETTAQGYLTVFIETYASFLLDMFVIPDILGIAPLPQNVLERLSKEIAEWQSLTLFPVL